MNEQNRRLPTHALRRLGFVVALLLTFNFSTLVLADTATTQPSWRAGELVGWQDTSFQQKIQMRARGAIVDLVDYIRQNIMTDSLQQVEAKIPRYNRLEDFGGWIKSDDPVNGCLDTRAIVLVRSADKAAPIKYAPSHCSVVKGLWHDPYTGDDFKTAKAVQIDHVVPLKHVYLTGAYKWSPERRCFYANFIHNDFHLLAVSGHENMSKGDNGPENYLPPDESFQCDYISTWMKVKAIWQLGSTQPELDAIQQVIQNRHCAVSKLQYSPADLQTERDAIKNVPQRCRDFAAADSSQSSETGAELETEPAIPRAE